MQLEITKTKKNEEVIKDTKGQKLVAAIFLVTAHLPESSPLRVHLRESILCLVKEQDTARVTSIVRGLTTILEGAAYAKEISTKNASVIAYEVSRYGALAHDEDLKIASMFELQTPPQKLSFMLPKKTLPSLEKRQQKDTSATTPEFGIKSQRKEDIGSFINARTMTTLKDIQVQYPTLSEKTIQRDLAVLVADGVIKKEGSKRWSMYLPA